MRKIKELADRIKEEVEDARECAEKFVECKAKGDMQRAAKYKEMAADELKHATYIHEMAVVDIEEISKVYKPPVEMQEKWGHEHKKFVEETALVKMILGI